MSPIAEVLPFPQAQLYLDMAARSLPPLQPLPDPLAETIGDLRAWPEASLFALARAIAAELDRRRLPVPVALPVLQAVKTFGACFCGEVSA